MPSVLCLASTLALASELFTVQSPCEQFLSSHCFCMCSPCVASRAQSFANMLGFHLLASLSNSTAPTLWSWRTSWATGYTSAALAFLALFYFCTLIYQTGNHLVVTPVFLCVQTRPLLEICSGLTSQACQ